MTKRKKKKKEGEKMCGRTEKERGREGREWEDATQVGVKERREDGTEECRRKEWERGEDSAGAGR